MPLEEHSFIEETKKDENKDAIGVNLLAASSETEHNTEQTVLMEKAHTSTDTAKPVFIVSHRGPYSYTASTRTYEPWQKTGSVAKPLQTPRLTPIRPSDKTKRWRETTHETTDELNDF